MGARRRRILFVGDSPDVPSGLARIGRALAVRLHESRIAEVGYAGYWGVGTRHVPFPQYVLGKFNHQVSVTPFLDAAQDFQPDIVFTIYDVPRLWEFAQLQRKWSLWGYFPIDSEGAAPGGALSPDQKEILESFDRVLAYGPFGARVLGATLGRDVGWIPHAIEDGWGARPGGRDLLLRGDLRVTPEARLLGVVATNQVRKDWGTVFQVLAELRETTAEPWSLWGHTDKTLAAWNLPALASAYGVENSTFLTNSLDDLTLQSLYSACNVTLAPGLGEGFGYPIIESLACGTPCVHVDYAGGADLLPPSLRVPPLTYRIEGAYSLKRPVLDVPALAAGLRAAVEGGDEVAPLAEPYRWRNVWPRWRRWFLDGLQ